MPTTTPIAERYIFFSAVGLFPIAADLFERGWATGRRPLVVVVALVALLALGARTFARTLDWRDDVTLARSAVEVEPGSVRAHFNLGVALKDRGDLPGALRQWEAALALDPSDAGSHSQLGTLAAVEGDLASAERHYRAAVAADPTLSLAWFNLGRVLEKTGRAAEALDCYRTFLARAMPDEGSYVEKARGRLAALEGVARP